MGKMVVWMDGSAEDLQGVQDSLAAAGWQTDYLASAGEGKWFVVLCRAGEQRAQVRSGREENGHAQGDNQQQQQQHRKQVK